MKPPLGRLTSAFRATVFWTLPPMPPSVVTTSAGGAVVPLSLAAVVLLLLCALVPAVQGVGVVVPASGTLQEVSLQEASLQEALLHEASLQEDTAGVGVLPARRRGGSNAGPGDARDVPAQLGGRGTDVGIAPREDYLSLGRDHSPGQVTSDRRNAFFPESDQLTVSAVDVENDQFESRRRNPSKIKMRYSEVLVHTKNSNEDVIIYKSSLRRNSMICMQSRNKRKMLCMDKYFRKPSEVVTKVTPDTASLFFPGRRTLAYSKGVPHLIFSPTPSPSHTSPTAGVRHSSNSPGVLQHGTGAHRQTLNSTLDAKSWSPSLSGGETSPFRRRRLLWSVTSSSQEPLPLETAYQTDAPSVHPEAHGGGEGRGSLGPDGSSAVQEQRRDAGAEEPTTDGGGLELRSSLVPEVEEGRSDTPAVLDGTVEAETADEYNDSEAWFGYLVNDNSSYHFNDSVGRNGSVAGGNCTEWTAGRSSLFQVSQLLYLAAFLVPHSFRASSFLLRVFLVAAQLLLVVWAAAQLCSLDVLVWCSTLLLVNATHALRCAYLLWPARIPAHLHDLYDKLFRPLKVERVPFSLLTREGYIQKLSAGELYAEEDFTQAATQLAVLLTGRLSASCNGTHLHYIFPNQFVDSPEWEAARGEEESEGLFQVTVAAEEDSCLLVWPRPHLLQLEAEQKALYIVLTCLVGKDITTKLYSLTEQLQQSSPGVDPSNLLLPGDPIPRGGRRFSADTVFTSTRGLVRSNAWRDYNLDRSAQAHQTKHRDSSASGSGSITPPSCDPSPRPTPTVVRQALAERLPHEPRKSYCGGEDWADGDFELKTPQGLGPNNVTCPTTQGLGPNNVTCPTTQGLRPNNVTCPKIVINDGDNDNTSSNDNLLERDCGSVEDTKEDLTPVNESEEKTESEHRRRDSLVRLVAADVAVHTTVTRPSPSSFSSGQNGFTSACLSHINFGTSHLNFLDDPNLEESVV